MKYKKISFIISCFNAKEYSKLCYNSIRKNLDISHEIILLSDNSTDGTNEWITKVHKTDKNTKIHINDTHIGIAYMYNKGVEMASNEIVCVLHSDMYIPRGFDNDILYYINEENIDFLTSYRVEPPLYPPSIDKLQQNFGETFDTFKADEFEKFCKDKKKELKGQFNEAMCFPWITTKKVYNSVGGNDTLFLKYMVDDDDFYYRIKLNGFVCKQPLDMMVYHFCSRSSKFENDNIKSSGSNKWNLQYIKSTRNFIRKWGFTQNFIYGANNTIRAVDTYIRVLHLNNITKEALFNLEPYFNYIIYNIEHQKVIFEYIESEQPKTLINLSSKFMTEDIFESEYVHFHVTYDSNLLSNILQTISKVTPTSRKGIYGNNVVKIIINEYIDPTQSNIINIRRSDTYSD